MFQVYVILHITANSISGESVPPGLKYVVKSHFSLISSMGNKTRISTIGEQRRLIFYFIPGDIPEHQHFSIDCLTRSIYIYELIRLSVCLSVSLSVCPSVRLSVCPSVRLSVCPFVIFLFILLSVCLYVVLSFLYVCPFVCLLVFPFVRL